MNTNTPSKELLSIVLSLGKSLNSILAIEDNLIRYGYVSILHDDSQTTVRIYELAIKTKQKYPSLDPNLVATDISEFW